jgi:3-(3-hydroxy-phenyl)propionate hydroxylase
MAPDAEPLPVVVVGAGPVGMAVAMCLSQRGIPVTIAEAEDQVSFGSRAICISRHSLEAAERLGFGAALEKLVLPWTSGRSYYRDVEVLHFQMPTSDHDVRAPMVNVSQSEFEQTMVDRLETDPLVTYLWQVRVNGYLQDERSVTLQLDTVEGPRTLRAAWVVAADGGRSRMRELAGLTLEGTSYEGRYVIADIHWQSPLPAERRVWFDPPSNPGSTVIMHRQPNDIWRIDYQLDEGQDPEAETRVERIKERIAQHLAWLGNDLPWTLEWHGIYSAHARALDDFVHGRVVFAGDAAHLVPIFGVRGLNSGIEDAETLGWMLAAVVRGSADPALLEVYSAERHSAWQQNITNAGKSTRVMTPGTDGYRATRAAVLRLASVRREFRFLLNPRQSSATHAHASPLTWHADSRAKGALPGDPVPDRVLVTSGGERTSVNLLRGTGFALLAFQCDATAAASIRDAARGLADAFAPEQWTTVLVNPQPDAHDDTSIVDEDLQRDLGGRAGEVFVVRPDGILLARLTDVSHLRTLGDSIRTGRAPAGGEIAPEWPDPTPPADRALEAVWIALSDALDRAGDDDREGFLVRLALLLGSQVSSGRFASAAGTALASDRQE